MYQVLNQVIQSANSIILGKEQKIRLSICCLLASGHLLIEDILGVGKTTLSGIFMHNHRFDPLRFNH